MSDASPFPRRLPIRFGSRFQRPRASGQGRSPSLGLTVSRGGRSSFHPLTVGSHVVGGGLECDVVVVGIEPTPLFRLTLASGAGGSTLQALSEIVTVGGRRLRRDETLPLAGPAAVTAADIAFRIDLPAAAGSAIIPASRRLAAAGLLSVAAVLLIAGSQFGGDEEPRLAVAAPAPAPSFSPPDVIAAELGAAARQAGLPVAVALADDGRTIRIEQGAAPLTAEGRTRLQRLVASIGRRSPVPIVDETRVASGLEGFVAAAGYEPFRFVVGTDGKRYRIGDALPGDWRIDEIRDGMLVVSRGGENDLVPFGVAGLAMRPGLETVADAGEP